MNHIRYHKQLANFSALAFAGIMGGALSGADEGSRNLLIESAVFNPGLIRRGSKKLGLKSESSHRFERGVDPEMVTLALNRALTLIQEVAGGSIVTGTIDTLRHPLPKKVIPCRVAKVNQLLGTSLSQGEIISILERLEIVVSSQFEHVLHLEIPSYRNDLNIEEDIIEEVGRVFGYHNIDKKRPLFHSSDLLDDPLYVLEHKIRSLLVQEGLQECITCDLISPQLARLNLEKGLLEEALIHVLHPQSQDQSVLRTSFLAGLLQVIKNNGNFGYTSLSGFEIGKIHFKEKENFCEQHCIALILTGKTAPHYWKNKPTEVDFFTLKGHIENVLEGLNILSYHFEPSHLKTLHPWRQAYIKHGSEILGTLGEVHPLIVQKFDIKNKIYFAELSLHELLKFQKSLQITSSPVQFPRSSRDWTVSLTEETPIQKVVDMIHLHRSYFLENFELIDLFVPSDQKNKLKNATFRFIYRDPKKTISLEIVEKEHLKMTQAIAEKLANCL